MSNPTVSFRISDYHLARGLRAIRLLEPDWKLTTPAHLIRTIFNDYIAKSEYANRTPLSISTELLEEITLARKGFTSDQAPEDKLPILGKIPQKSQQQLDQEIEQDKYFAELREEAKRKKEQKELEQNLLSDKEIDAQIELAKITAAKLKPSQFHDPNITESEISTITDFSPPADWKE